MEQKTEYVMDIGIMQVLSGDLQWLRQAMLFEAVQPSNLLT